MVCITEIKCFTDVVKLTEACPTSTAVLYTLGLMVVLNVVWRLLRFFKKQFFSFPSSLNQYRHPTKKSWAIVTGGSGGIGLSYVKELIKRRYNVLILALGDKVLDEAKVTLQEPAQKAGVTVDFMAVDFSKPSEALVQIRPKLDTLEDIAILINNAGITVDPPAKLDEVPLGLVEKLLSINVAALTLMTHAVVPYMLKRGKECKRKSLVMNMGSFVARIPVPMLQVYSASKKYVEHLNMALAAEYSGKIDFLAIAPWWVATAMTKIRNTSWRVISPARVANNAFSRAGNSEIHDPYWIFAIFDYLVETLPLGLVQKGVAGFLANVRAIYLRRQAKKAEEEKKK